jgi:hypothetical protein
VTKTPMTVGERTATVAAVVALVIVARVLGWI